MASDEIEVQAFTAWDLGPRWIEREQSMTITITLNCAVSVKTPPPGGLAFPEWLVQRLDKFP